MANKEKEKEAGTANDLESSEKINEEKKAAEKAAAEKAKATKAAAAKEGPEPNVKFIGEPGQELLSFVNGAAKHKNGKVIGKIKLPEDQSDCFYLEPRHAVALTRAFRDLYELCSGDCDCKKK